MNFWLYILECIDKSLYVGITGNLPKRIREHKDGLVPYTKNRQPFKAIYKQTFKSRKEVASKEKEIKGWRREKKLNFINSLR